MDDIKILKKNKLFYSLSERDIQKIVQQSLIRFEHYNRDELVFSVNEKMNRFGIVLKGRLHIIKDDYWGNRSILAEIRDGDVFAEAFYFSNVDYMPVSVQAKEDTQIAFIEYDKILDIQEKSYEDIIAIQKNMIQILANKNVMLTQQIEYYTKRKIREKLIVYLSNQAIMKQSNTFSIPFNRNELASYLSVDRSALSNELSKMQAEGLLEYEKNNFILHDSMNQ